MKQENVLSRNLIFAVFIAFSLAQPLAVKADAAQKGEELYFERCAKCHGFEGEGFSDIYPSVKNSTYLRENVERLPCLIHNGSKGELSARKIKYDQIMPATTDVSASEISLLIQYMQTTWEHPVTAPDVENILQNCDTTKK